MSGSEQGDVWKYNFAIHPSWTTGLQVAYTSDISGERMARESKLGAYSEGLIQINQQEALTGTSRWESNALQSRSILVSNAKALELSKTCTLSEI